ncbi:MAG TPA: hypothetical protein VFQ15_09595 [Jiangellaceae bacterium]|nr:hypothetical protein [Jiangellaceae bacterium]
MASSSVMIYRPNVDAMVARALDAGAAVVTPLTDLPSSDRCGTVVDPFGHRWRIAAAVAMQSDQDEPISRADALCALTLLRTVRPVA